MKIISLIGKFLVYIKLMLIVKRNEKSSNVNEYELQNRMKENEDRASFFSWDLCPKATKLRILVVIMGFSLCFLGLTYRLIVIANNKYVKSDTFQTKANNFRKEIVDRNGNLLAVNLPTSSLFANPKKVVNAAESVDKLVRVMPELNKDKLLTELKSGRSFIWVKRDITPAEQEKIFNLGLPGFEFEHEQKRIYTFGKLLSHVIGYVGRDFIGLAGLEKYHDKFLNNSEIILNKGEQKKSLELSIDVRLQNILSEEIELIMNEFRASGAVGVIANPKTGEILAMVSKPDFDPHHPSNASSQELFNRASHGVMDTGSVFKTITIAVGLETDNVTLQDAYDVTHMKVGKFSLKDYHPHKGWQTVPEIFLHSSNIGTAQIVLEIGEEKLKNYLKI